MERHEPEQLNTPAVSEEYSLEDIIREFGTVQESAKDDDAVNAVPEKAEAAEVHPPKPKKSISDDTMVFKPVHNVQNEPDLEAPTKIAADGNLPPAKIAESTEQKRKKQPRRERREPRENKRYGEIKDCAPPSAQEKLKSCHKGLGMRYIRLLFLSVPVLLSLFLLLYRENNWTFLPIVQSAGYLLPLALLFISIALSYDVFVSALIDLLHFKFGLHTLTVIASVLSIILAISQTNDTQTYCAVVCLLLFAQLKALHAQNVGMFHTLRTICTFDAPMGIYDTSKLLENKNSLRRDAGNVTDFLERLERRNAPRRIMRLYSLGLFFLLPLLAYFISTAKQISLVHTWLLLLLGAVPYGMALSFARPFSSIAKRLAGYRGALCGWHGARVFGGKHTIVLSDEDLFPKKNITSNGMKIYGTHKSQRIIAYALAALKLVDSPLVELFQSLLESQYGKQFPISEHRIYDDGGIGAQIAGDIVLVGSLSFMRSMGVHMPAGTRVRQAVYVSVGGELAGIFAVKYKPSNSTRAGLRDILANHNFAVILATRDFLISPELIAAKYELPTDTMRFPHYNERLKIAASAPSEGIYQGALIANDTFGAFAVTVASGRTLRISTVASLCINLFAGILGLLLCALLLAWNAAAVATPLHIATFQLLWAFLSSFVSFMILKF